MKKQTARNNEFLAETKKLYNDKVYKRVSKMVNEGQQELVEYMLATGLYWYVRGEQAAKILMEQGHPVIEAKSTEEIEKLFEKAGIK